MAEIRIEIPDPLHKSLKRRALEEDRSMKALVIELLEQGLGKEETKTDE